jgi:hypothetical protein
MIIVQENSSRSYSTTKHMKVYEPYIIEIWDQYRDISKPGFTAYEIL